MENYCSPTYFIDADHPDIIAFSRTHTREGASQKENAVSLYYAVRDKIRYNPYSIEPRRAAMKASGILSRGEGYCVAKAVLLAACLRTTGIPARLGFADVRNHLTTDKLREKMGTDLFVWHGYTDVFLENRWVKATPAFNLSLCQAFGVKPLEFDGTEDSIFHPFDTRGNRHMEYVNDHGWFADLPWDRILTACRKTYPKYFEDVDTMQGNFSEEAKAERSDE
ncbi:MAG TPA: transglutaminase [Desulfobacteraceae bacterium]|nr:transglutaminase [Desulfobacteraceae bacterium]|tara:strand:- start:1193 stop:1861 length:669 start_codon:yes stop_codon:yes gene_type:complete